VFGAPRLAPVRVGQTAYKALVQEAYSRRCAVTGDKIVPVLQAAHIRRSHHGELKLARTPPDLHVCGPVEEDDQSATPDAFELLHFIVGTRLRRGLLAVVDATNVQQAARALLVRLARSHDVLVDAVVIDVPESVAVERNRYRPGRDFGSCCILR
jgi:predicted kinase